MAVSRLSPDDQAYLKVVGDSPSPADPVNVEEPKPAAQPAKVMGPIEAEGSHYYYYVPSSLNEGSKAPLIFYTGSGGGSADHVKVMVEGAEICGWIAACSVELKNGMPLDEYPKQTDRCLKSLFTTLPIDSERVYFTGNSGGARVAFTNSSRTKGAGVLAYIAGAEDGELSRSSNYFIVSGATDYNRYETAETYSQARRQSAYRLHPGSHDNGPGWLNTEGMVWLQAMAFLKTEAMSPERAAFEGRVITWIDKIRTSDPHRAAWQVDFFQRNGVSPEHQQKFKALADDLLGDPVNLAYIQGIADIEELADDVLAKISKGSEKGHTTPEIQKKCDKLLGTYAGTPWIEDILTALKNKTGG